MSDDAIFEKVVSEPNLESLFNQKVRSSSSRGRDGNSPRNMTDEQIINLIQGVSKGLLNGTYRFSPYRELLRLKGSQKLPRVISIPTVRDRLALIAITDYLLTKMPMLVPQRPYRLISQIRESIAEAMYSDFLRIDIVGFYPNVSHTSIESAISGMTSDVRILDAIFSAIKSPTVPDGTTRIAASLLNDNQVGLPAGTPLANVLGELVLSKFDNKFTECRDVALFRYVDDILILAPPGKRQRLRQEVRKELGEIGLKAHPKGDARKASSGRIGHDDFEYLGYLFSSGRITVDRQRLSRLFENLARPITMYRRAILENDPELHRTARRAEWWLNFRITGCIADGARRGWLPFYSQVDDISLLHHLDDVVAKMMHRVPSPSRFTPKSFVRAYTLTRDRSRDKNGYILNFDKIVDDEGKRNLLLVASTYRPIPQDSAKLDSLFRRFIGFAVKEIETDVGGVS